MVSLRETYQKLQTEAVGKKESADKELKDHVPAENVKRPAIALHQVREVRDSPWHARQPYPRQQTPDFRARSWIIGVLAIVFIAMCVLYAYVSKPSIPTVAASAPELSLSGAYPDAEIVPEL
jgi:hypothetical protein